MNSLKIFLFFFIVTKSCDLVNSTVCDICSCNNKKDEPNILLVNCSYVPKFAKMTNTENGNEKQDVYLTMEGMNLTSIQRYVRFETLNVKSISFNYNQIKTIAPYIFSKFENLTVLSLVDNKIENITSESFSGLEYLKSLNISYNAIKTLNMDHLSNLKSLEALDLRGNQLTLLDFTLPLENMKINFLDLSGNSFINFPTKSLRLLPELTYFNLSRNQLKYIPENGFEKQYKLEKLDLSNNHITEVNSNSFTKYNSLKKLIIQHNLITDTNFIKVFEKLDYLDLSYNSLTNIGNTTSWSRNLIQLSVGNNGLSNLDDVLKGLSQLQILDASWNQCNDIPRYINPDLNILILDDNAISKISPRSEDTTTSGNLTYVSLSDLPHLKVLQNGALSGLFSSNTKETCHRLVISRTGLNKIERKALRNYNICELDLSWNDLTDLPEDTFDWDNLQKIDLQGNPWHCSCDMQWLLTKVVAKMYTSHQELLDNFRCHTPKSLEGTRLVHWFNKSELVLCNGDNLVKPNFITMTSSPAMIAVDVVLGLLAIALVVTGFYLQRKVIKHRRQRKNRRL